MVTFFAVCCAHCRYVEEEGTLRLSPLTGSWKAEGKKSHHNISAPDKPKGGEPFLARPLHGVGEAVTLGGRNTPVSQPGEGVGPPISFWFGEGGPFERRKNLSVSQGGRTTQQWSVPCT